MNPLRYHHYDVFTDRRLSGNQLAVFPQAPDLVPALMQQIANEMAFPETTFVLPPASPENLARLRIFTPHTELPMAGHPTIGTTFALAHEQSITSGTETVTLELGIGPTELALEWTAGTLDFAWMSQAIPEFGGILEQADTMARALSLEESDIADTSLPVQIVSAGVPFVFVPLVSREAVDACRVERTHLQGACAAIGSDELPVFVFALDKSSDRPTAYCRMFAPIFGIAEDPATGGASGPLGAYLLHHGALPMRAQNRITNLQGVKMGRASEVHICVACNNGEISAVAVGGRAISIGHGTITI